MNKTKLKKITLTPPNDFRQWISVMGYKGAKNQHAGAALGITGVNVLSELSTGKRSLTITERLAMSAVRLGLQPWDPDYDGVLVASYTKVSRPTGG